MHRGAIFELGKWSSSQGQLKSDINKYGVYMGESFYSEDEKIVIESFLENGYHIFDLENLNLLNEIKEQILVWSKIKLGLGDISREDFFNNTSSYVTPDKLNAFRVDN